MTTIKTDLHMHSQFSSDGRSSMRKMCARAVKLGLTQIAFTEHAEWTGHVPQFRPNQGYFRELAACQKRFGKQGLTVLSGVELGNPHWFSAESKAILAQHTFDIRIASVHWLYDTYNIHGPAPFDNHAPLQVFTDYLQEAETMLRECDFDILAHIDRIWWRATMMGVACSAHEIETPLRNMLAAATENKIILELNTKYIDLEPGWVADLKMMLQWYKESGGTHIAVNSDAHHHTQIGRNFALASDMLEAAGLEPFVPAR